MLQFWHYWVRLTLVMEKWFDWLISFVDGQVGWIGLQDFLSEGTFSWADGSSLGSYTNWANNQPDNNGQGQVWMVTILWRTLMSFHFQHCAVLRTQGDWNDVICGGTRAFVCQRNPWKLICTFLPYYLLLFYFVNNHMSITFWHKSQIFQWLICPVHDN